MGSNPLHAKQWITLSGLGTPEFAKALLGIVNIRQRFEETSVARHIQGIQTRRERGHPVITLGNRFFADSDEDASDAIPIDDIIDPLNILRSSAPGAIHTSDNNVQYFERHVDAKG